jgi:hypothetical protein
MNVDLRDQFGVCRRCGGTFPTCCSCPDDSHWNRTVPPSAGGVIAIGPVHVVEFSTNAAAAAGAVPSVSFFPRK